MAVMDIVRGIIGGVAGAAGDQNTADKMDALNQQARVQKQNQLKAQIAPLGLAVKNLQTGIQNAYAQYQTAHPEFDGDFDQWKTGPGSQQFQQFVDSTGHAVHSMREILHPDYQAGPTDWLKTHLTDRLHITNADHRADEQANNQAWNQYNEGQLTQARTNAVTANPLSPEQQKQADLIKAGVTPKAAPVKPIMKNFKGPNGEIQAFDASKPDDIPAGWALADSGKETSDTRARADYAAFTKNNPSYSGSFEKWKSEQAGAGRQASNRDDQYIAIQQKKALGQPLTPDEHAHEAAYDLWVRKTKVDPRVAGAIASGANRYMPVVDPNDPEKVTVMKASDAARMGASTPASIAYQTDKAVTRWATTGEGGTKINSFNTAVEHLQLLQQASKALQNGDTQLFNKISNAYKTATGQPAPTNFNSVKAAVAGEIAKTFSSATIPEQEAIGATINNAESPDQISGATDYYISLMNGKMQALQGQYEQGKQGKPNFPTGPKTKQLQAAQSGTRKVGDIKAFPNGKKGVWDGQGWVAQP